MHTQEDCELECILLHLSKIIPKVQPKQSTRKKTQQNKRKQETRVDLEPGMADTQSSQELRFQDEDPN